MTVTSSKFELWIEDRLNQTFVVVLLAGLGVTYFIVGLDLHW